jgi:nucleotide-binding universal stress UspA family protein
MGTPHGRNDDAPSPSGRGWNPAGRAAVVVVGLDGSEPSWDAFWWACGEARRLGGRAVAVFVSSCTDPSMAAVWAVVGVAVCDYDALDRAAAAEAARLRAAVRRHAAENDLDIAFVHARGDAAGELLRVARTVRADLIVVGRSAKVRHQLIGSLGRSLVTRRWAPAVVVVP